MSDLFASIILNQVDAALSESPKESDCLNLFKIFNPKLELKDISAKTSRLELWKEVKVRIHPDKHNKENQKKATTIFQKLSAFISACEGLSFSLKRRRSEDVEERNLKISKPVKSSFPPQFHVHSKWNGSSYKKWHSFFDYSYSVNENDSASLCYNMRGQICHFGSTSRNIGVQYKMNRMTDFRTIYKPDTLRTTEMIKEEIVNHGPVLSRSYNVPNMEESDYPVIMGWETKVVGGEGWLVRIPSQGKMEHFIAMGTCNIEDDIAIPNDDLRKKKWQPGAYLSVPDINLKSSSPYSYSCKNKTAKLSHSKFIRLWGMSGKKSVKEMFSYSTEFEVFNNELCASHKARIEDCLYLDESAVEIHFSLS